MKENNNIENTSTAIGWFERVLDIANKYRIQTILKSVFIILLIAGTVGFIKNPTWIFEKLQELERMEHTERVEMALKNTQLIQYEMDALRNKTNASRVVLLTFHNQKETLNGVPYVYLTAQNEALDYGIAPIAERYENLKCSLYPFVNYIIQNGYFSGDIEELTKIDKALAYRMMGNDVTHTSILNIEGETLLGVLVITYTGDCKDHNCRDVELDVRKSATKIGILLSQIR